MWILLIALYLITPSIHAFDYQDAAQKQLYVASSLGHYGRVRELLLSQSKIFVNGNPTTEVPLVVAARNGYRAVIEVLLEHNANVDAIETAAGETALIAATREKPFGLGVIPLLLKHGANVNISSDSGNALTRAVDHLRDDLLKLYLPKAARGTIEHALSYARRLRAKQHTPDESLTGIIQQLEAQLSGCCVS